MKKRFSEEQIIGFLQEAEGGLAAKELCRRHGFSEASFYLWRSKFGDMSVSEAKRLRKLETENARLKKLLAESMLEIEVTREALTSPLIRLFRFLGPALVEVSHLIFEAFHHAADCAKHTNFALDRVGESADAVINAVRKGAAGFNPKTANMTNAELQHVVSNPSLFNKPRFIETGSRFQLLR